jgi:cytochrome c-type biogenesis protein CcmF
MIPELGNFALVLASVLALGGAGLGLYAPREPVLQSGVLSMVFGQWAFSFVAFTALIYAFVVDDFSVSYVANQSNSLLPWYYKVSAAWGGHEGSFLLWILIMGTWMLAFALRSDQYPDRFTTRVLGVLSLLNLGFICFALFTSNPFLRLIPLSPADGADLNPLLQDFGLIVHPPLLYAGYVGWAIPFAMAVAALLEGRVDATWARWCRTWTNMAWALLTCGIALGSWWAYYELGWGGWWFWDPVENASFMPWLAATALVHSLSVTENRGTFKSWTLLLAITAFSFSLLGAFIVRSGVLTSVHSFAVDPERGMYILIFLALVVGGSLSLYAARAGQNTAKVGYEVLSREFFMLVNNVIMVVSLAVVLWGTLAPIGYEAITGGRISIGTPFFNAFFVPLGLMLLGALALVPVLNWKRTRAQVLASVYQALGVSVLLGGLIWFALDPASLLVAGAVGLSVWVVLTHARQLWFRLGKGSVPAAYIGMTLAHLGFAMGTTGIAITATQSVESDVRMSPQSSIVLAGQQVTFTGVIDVVGPNYGAQQGIFIVTDGDRSYELRPEKRQYFAGGNTMTEAGISAGFLADTYISLGEPLEGGAWAVRAHYKPLVRWVWLGALLMAFGGILAVFDKRYARQRRRQEARQGEVTLS